MATLTTNIELKPTPGQVKLLLATLSVVNKAATFACSTAVDKGVRGRVKIHDACYYGIREMFGLSAQLSVRAIDKAKVALSREPGKKHEFRDRGSVLLDPQCISYSNGSVSIQVLGGRIKVPFVLGDYQHDVLLRAHDIGSATLGLRRNGTWFVGVAYEVLDEAPIAATEALGVDRGLINIATTSDGERLSGAELEARRTKRRDVRGSMQRKAAKKKAAGKRPKQIRRRLKKMGQRESRMQRDKNHCISKKLVQQAKGTARAIVFEDLKGISRRTPFNRTMRRRLGGWAFHQLESFTRYKAQIAGVPFITVDPRNTSRECPKCGHVDKKNRPTQSAFKCMKCSYSGNADCVAAVNIRRRGESQLARSCGNSGNAGVLRQAPSIAAQAV